MRGLHRDDEMRSAILPRASGRLLGQQRRCAARRSRLWWRRKSGERVLVKNRREDANKQHGKLRHLHAVLRVSFLTAERRRNGENTGGGAGARELGFEGAGFTQAAAGP